MLRLEPPGVYNGSLPPFDAFRTSGCRGFTVGHRCDMAVGVDEARSAAVDCVPLLGFPAPDSRGRADGLLLYSKRSFWRRQRTGLPAASRMAEQTSGWKHELLNSTGVRASGSKGQ